MLRPILGVVAGAAVAASGALLLGEYAFAGWAILGASVLFGLFVAEVMVAAGGRRGVATGVLTAAFTAAGLLWAAWISSGRDLTLLAGEGWLAITLGAVASGVTASWTRGRAGNHPASSRRD